MALLHFAFRRVVEGPDRILDRRGLGRVHHRILFFVGRRPGICIGDLLRALDVSKQALHRPLKELVQQGLLEASPDPDNRRLRRLRLTRRGVDFEDRLSGIQRQIYAEIFEAHGPAAERAWRAVTDDLGGRRASAAIGVSPTARRRRAA